MFLFFVDVMMVSQLVCFCSALGWGDSGLSADMFSVLGLGGNAFTLITVMCFCSLLM